jgi:hypothetical protein
MEQPKEKDIVKSGYNPTKTKSKEKVKKGDENLRLYTHGGD